MKDFKNIKDLPEIHREILKKMILRYFKRPRSFDFSTLYETFDYHKHAEEDISLALKQLVEDGFFAVDNDSYIFTRDGFFQVKTHFKQSIFWHTYGVALGVSMVLAVVLGTSLHFSSRSRTRTSAREELETRTTIDSIDTRVKEVESMLEGLSQIPDTSKIVLVLENLRNRISIVETTAVSLTRTISHEPLKAIRLTSLSSEIQHLKNKQKDDYDSIARELDRISNYNRTIIVFMITFMVCFVGIALLNVFKQRKGP